MNTRRATLMLIPLILLACNAAAVAPSTSPSPSPTLPPQGLDGRTFLSTSVTDDGADHPLVPGTRIRLNFNGNQLGASVGCNSMGGTFALDGNRLMFQGGGMTEMGCDPARHAQDDWLFGFIGSQPTIALDGNNLTLTSGGTVIQLLDSEIAEPDLPLVGTLWTVDSIISGDAVSSMPQGVTATILIGADGSVTLDTGCNSGGGRLTVDGQNLQFSDIATTERACDGAAGQVEALFLNVLQAPAIGYAIDAGSLTLMAGDQGLQFRGSATP
jgi:heat shock protein HslJ